MAYEIVVVCGDYARASALYPNMYLTSQVTETSQQIVDQGEEVGLMMLRCPDEVLYVFTNNDHYLNGVRLACLKGRINYENVLVRYFSSPTEHVPDPAAIDSSVTKGGRLSSWPACFCALEDALCQL